MYAQLCKRLSEEAPNFEPPDKPCTFKLLLLNKCKAEFEKRAEILEQYGKKRIMEEDERRQLAKRKMLGNIKFIGELGKLEILSESILHQCIQQLLRSRGDDMPEDLECVCQILRTCGRILDSERGKSLMDQYFQRMQVLADNHDLAPRIRFMLRDVIDLRMGDWVPRKAALVEGPMPIHQISRPVDDERPSYRNRGERNNHHQDRDTDRASDSMLFRHPMKTRGGLEDVFMGLSMNSSGGGGGGGGGGNLIPTHYNTNGFGGGGGGGGRDGGYRGHNNQRSGGGGYNNYNNNQRGQYKHNQNNSNSQYNNQNKDLAPRFKKNLIVAQEENLGELQLRPNSMLFNKAAVKSNNMINNHSRPTLEPPMAPPPVAPKQTTTLLPKEPLPIKQVVAEKAKQSKKDKGPNKEEILKKCKESLENFIKGDLEDKEFMDTFKELKVPDKFSKEVVLSAFTAALDMTDEEKIKFVKLLGEMKSENLINTSVQDCLKSLCNDIKERESESTTILSSVAVLLSNAVAEKLITLADSASLTDNGAHYPLFLLVLQDLHKMRGKSELTELFNDSKVNLLSQLPENDKTKERLAEILEERDLTFLYPLLRIQAELAKQLQADPNPQQFYKWIKENLEPSNYTDPGFINALMTVLLKYITQEAAVSCPQGDDKALCEKEKILLQRYQQILQHFLHDQPKLQLVAVYSLQVHFYSLGFPKGQLLRWFMHLYDFEIVEDEAFFTWKEDVTDAYPGKGQALFQVNQWLIWLQEAESEEEVDE